MYTDDLKDLYDSDVVIFFRYLATVLFFIGFFKMLIDKNNFNYMYSLVFAFIFALPSVFIRILIFIKKCGSTYAGKLICRFLIGFLTIISGGFALSLGKKLIHSAMLLDPSLFPCTTTVLSAFLLIPSWIFILSLALFITITCLMLYNQIIQYFKMLYYLIIKHIKISRTTPGFSEFISDAVGFIGIILLGAVIYSSTLNYVNFSQKNKLLYRIIQDMVILLDFYNGNECENIKTDQLFCYVGENKVVIPSNDFFIKEKNFTVTNCK